MELMTRQTNLAQLASVVKGGGQEFAVAANKPFNIRYKVAGEWVDVLDVEVPKGKAWRVIVGVEVVETDA